MGKYMRQKGRVEKRAAIDGTLGVRTRARALAMAESSKQEATLASTGQSLRQLRNDANCAMENECVALLTTRTSAKATYMELRSRRLQKNPLMIPEKEKSGSQRQFLTGAIADRARQTTIQSPAITLVRKTRRAFSGRSSAAASSGKRFVASSAEVSFQTSATAKACTESSAATSESISSGRHLGTLTRHRKQLLASLRDVEEDVEERFYGENQVVSGNENRQRSCFREDTPDGSRSQAVVVEAAGSSASGMRQQQQRVSLNVYMATGQAPTSDEIEAFFQGSERQERRRFIERYNFDPANERPLRGRYQWTCL